ncbi:hypothetical protein P8918_13455 [Bacillus spizizenii]|nr:hypothetical protein [Bacillus spizizenii]MEC0842034.1 hypothetical protein [Bacillus spizizenii]
MLNSREAFEEAIRHFPKWMDIRKRKSKSEGGKFLQSMIDELDDIQGALEDYRKDFFIINYIGREDTVIDYLYAAEIGDVEKDNFILLTPNNKVTFDVKEFYFSDKPLALYQEGRLLFKTRNIEPDDIVKYSRNGFAYTAKLSLIHIWNVIDEFALFAGIERQKGETNKELLERTLLVFKNRTNSTELGLKNAIMNIVSNFTDVSPGEISIDKPDQEKLFEKDEEFGTVIEKLAQLNKDTYRTKQWDSSRWEHPFKKLDHVSPKWNEEIKDIQDGVGHNDALKASLLSEMENSETTDVQVDLYEKSDVQINEYIRDRRVEVDVDLQLKKYENVLKPKEVEYKITAAETTDLSDSNVYIDSHRVVEGENEHYVADLVMNPTDIADITVERGKLKPNTKYRLQFIPREEYGQMEIFQINITKDGSKSSLMKEKGAYRLNEEGQLVNSNVRLHADSTHDFKDHSNIANTKTGFTLADATQDGVAVVDITGMQNQYVKTEFECRETNIIRDRELVKIDDSFIVNDSNQLESIDREGDIVIDVVATQLYYEMESGNCIVTKTIDGEQLPSEIWFDAKSEHMKFDKAKKIKIVIRKLNNDMKLIINNIRYARYDIEMMLEKGSFINTPLGSVIPATGDGPNSIIMTIRTYSGYSPVVKFIHVGSSLKNAMYETEVFQSGSITYVDFDSNCKVRLVELDNNGTAVSTTDNYVCKNLYRNTRNSAAYLQIDTSGFVSIRRTTPFIDRFSYQGKMSDWIRLEPGEELDTVLIDGNVRSLIERVFINDLLLEGPYDKVYASRKLKGFIVQSGNKEKLVKLSREDINAGADAYTVHNLPYGARGAFIIDASNNVESIGTSHSQAFQYFYVFPANTQEHVAYNKVKMLRPESTGVKIVDMFTPIVPENKLMIYTIAPVSKEDLNAKVEFEKEDGVLETWSLGKKSIRVKVEIDQELSDNYELETASIRKKFILSNNIDLEQKQVINGVSIDLAEYIVVPPEGMRIIHENRLSQPETFYVEEDGFNKLRYSNINMINSIKKANGANVPAADYQLLKEEGIIAWKNEELVGQQVIIEYRYGVPRFITFSHMEKLYELVGYNVEAYRLLSSLYYRDLGSDTLLTDSDAKKVTEADRVIASSSNPNFRVRVDNDIIRLTKINEEDYIAVKAGFFYQDGIESYHYADRNENLLERMSNIDLINTERLSGEVRFHQQSKNYMPESSMKPKRTGEVSYVDFVRNERVEGLSRIDALTACDNVNHWNAFEMILGFDDGLNGLGMTFDPLSKDGYAIMDITKYVGTGTILSMYTEGDVDVMIAKERKHQRHSFNKSVFAEPEINLEKHEEFRYFIFNEENYNATSKYYLMVTGKGLVDDIVIKDYFKDEEIPSIHRKNITALGLEIDEHARVNHIQRLMFDVDGNKLERLEITEDGVIRTGANVDWGFTKVQEYKNDWSICTLREVDLVKDSFIRSIDRIGTIETESMYIRNRGSIRSMIFKVNEVLTKSTSGFRIEVHTSDTSSGRYNLIAAEDNTNVLVVPQNRLSNYIRVKVDMPPGKVINNLEIYSEYIETDSPLRIGNYQNGQLLTKIYDSGFGKHYAIKGFGVESVSELGKIDVEVRAFRQDDNRLVWTNWKQLQLNEELEVTNSVEFEDYRFFQFRISIRSEHASMKLNNIDLEVIR